MLQDSALLAVMIEKQLSKLRGHGLRHTMMLTVNYRSGSRQNLLTAV